MCVISRNHRNRGRKSKMVKCVKKPNIVNARLITESEIVLTEHGQVRAEAGDWILSSPATFEKDYGKISEENMGQQKKLSGQTIEVILKIAYCILRCMDKDVRISKRTIMELPSDWAENLVLNESLDGTYTLLTKKQKPVQKKIITQDKKLIIPSVSMN